MEALRESARDLGAGFVGECGLDALRGDLAEQAPWFEAQIDAAISLDLPLVLHVVKAHDQALAILERSGAKNVGGLVHGFSGGAQHIRHYIELGFAISLGGAVTWPNARRAVAAAQAVPADWLLVETDAPDQPALRRPRGEPADLVEIIEAIAAIRGDSAVEVATRSAANAARILRLPDREQMF